MLRKSTHLPSFAILLFCFVLYSACSGQESQQFLEKISACELFDLKKVSEIVEAEEGTMNMQDLSFGEDQTICYYFNKEGNRKLFIRLNWKSEKAIQNKVLEKRYARFIEEGENDIPSFEDISIDPENQILYGIGMDREKKYIHLIRKRFNNRVEVQLEIVKEFKDDNAKNQLLSIIRDMD